jgi:hypothetical protein
VGPKNWLGFHGRKLIIFWRFGKQWQFLSKHFPHSFHETMKKIQFLQMKLGVGFWVGRPKTKSICEKKNLVV